jgi:hypothetical protein
MGDIVAWRRSPCEASKRGVSLLAYYLLLIFASRKKS